MIVYCNDYFVFLMLLFFGSIYMPHEDGMSPLAPHDQYICLYTTLSVPLCHGILGYVLFTVPCY